MKSQVASLTCVLLLWKLTVFVSCQGDSGYPEIKVAAVSDGIKLSCVGEYNISSEHKGAQTIMELKYKDENTGEYTCVPRKAPGKESTKIFVMFRTCDNCIELDKGTLAGVVIGDVLATVVVGVAVYLIASAARPAALAPLKQSSDKQHFIPNRSKVPNDEYQKLKFQGGNREEYDVIQNRR
ncbi:T-cell surface glycoprotein CD3 delta chain-like [Thalassophryne amazonica]|uniref:T-cell surface glycoprotein CD3 delta chain-like n=1 Tax=Thalassophryne amazonica TaxID=390379 RepID=UPI001471B23D|nr:T-cell surface glycoprotein CD3 delta chain-like [Thalassophryne amazonica]XP_034023801.1 T-cell surface glycoprotein CD3 delta chain-like [Thalassophryne amazonica]